MHIPISGFIIAKNEATHITKAINSLKNVVDDLYVIDSGSTDNTLAIAEKLGAKVVFNQWQGYVQQKIYGESLCKNEWILNIDADEELSTSLQEEIKLLFNNYTVPPHKAYTIDLVIIHRLDKADKPRLFAPLTRAVRLYNKRYASFNNNKNTRTHDSVLFNTDITEHNDKQVKGKASSTSTISTTADRAKHLPTPDAGCNAENRPTYNIGKLKAPAYHHSRASIEHLLDKANFFTNEQAIDLVAHNRHPSALRTAFEFFFCFFKTFFIRRYFILGFNGFIDAMLFAFVRFIRLAKAREAFILKKNKYK